MLHKVSQQELVLSITEELKTIIEMPAWAEFVKTGAHRETLPKNPDWWFIRAASILRIVFIRGPVGVSKLRVRYGGRKNRGYRPDRFALASGKVIRTILQELEKAELIKQDKVGTHKGRVITPKGGSLLAKATKITAAKEKAKPVVEVTKPVVEKTEEKVAEAKTEKAPKTETKEKPVAKVEKTAKTEKAPKVEVKEKPVAKVEKVTEVKEKPEVKVEKVTEVKTDDSSKKEDVAPAKEE